MAKINNRIRLTGGQLVVNMDGTNIDAWASRVSDLAARANDMRPVFVRYGQYLLAAIERNFAAQGRPAWQQLSPAYAKWKRKRYGNAPILVATGGLRHSFYMNPSSAELVIGNARKVNGYSLFDIHQEGKGHNPKRPMLVLSNRDKAELTRLTNRYLEGVAI